MDSGFLIGLENFFRTVNQILTAGIAITAFSLFLYVLTFKIADKVIRTFLSILLCIVIVFTSEAIGSTTTQAWEIEIWLRIQWVGIILLPVTYFLFSDALLATTGKPSRGRRRLFSFFAFCLAIVFLVLLPFSGNYSYVIYDIKPAPYLYSTVLTWLFLGYYILNMVLSWYNFVRAYRRTITSNSRRRMVYLTAGALAPAVGSFPYLLFASDFAAQHQIIFWFISCVVNIVLGVMLVVMAYSVAFFGVSWPDRVIKTRLLKWLLRGPLTASITLGVVTIIRRIGAASGQEYTAWVPIAMVGFILLCEYLITILAPFGERMLFFKDDRENLELLRTLENRMMTENDLRQFLEMIAAAICDRLQVKQAAIWIADAEGFIMSVKAGGGKELDLEMSDSLVADISNTADYDFLNYQNINLMALRGNNREVLGVIGVSSLKELQLDREQTQALKLLVQRATYALRDRFSQNQILASLQTLTPQVEYLQKVRAVASYDESYLFNVDDLPPDEELVLWVRDALGHYWGGPKLTESPLNNFRIVETASEDFEGNFPNALRSILKSVIEQIRPPGERKYTSEWILYNILEMKYMEGRKMREIASRLALSEADLYRKQRVAIEAVARAVMVMEDQARKQNGNH